MNYFPLKKMFRFQKINAQTPQESANMAQMHSIWLLCSSVDFFPKPTERVIRFIVYVYTFYMFFCCSRQVKIQAVSFANKQETPRNRNFIFSSLYYTLPLLSQTTWSCIHIFHYCKLYPNKHIYGFDFWKVQIYWYKKVRRV